jgi:NAD(P)-dependent dehydrogenase (short-subunit alcohol dehydrogenase family)
MTNTLSPVFLDGICVLVTGGSRGLGREMALALARSGAHVMISGQSDSQALADTVKDLRTIAGTSRKNGRIEYCIADVSDPNACKAMVDTVIETFGKLDVLINNAGIGMRQVSETFNTNATRFWETSTQDWAKIMDTNFNGAFFTARSAAQHMLAQGSGKIVNISTSAQTMVRKGYAPYGPSKAALEAGSRIWAQDLEGTGVTVNVYLPGGASDTDFIPGGADRTGADGNLLPASIMRNGIVWLCSPLSDGITGARFSALHWGDDTTETSAALAAKFESCTTPTIM